jgi:hypothetical protein
MKPVIALGLAAGLCVFLVGARAEADAAKQAVSNDARVKIEADVEKCRSRQLGTHRAAAQCINEAVQRTLISVDYPYMDLLQVVSAYRIACAQKMDGNELSEADCTKRMGELRTRITAEENKRNSATPEDGKIKPAAGRKPANYVALLKGLADWSNGVPEDAAKPGTIVCFESGPMITCR